MSQLNTYISEEEFNALNTYQSPASFSLFKICSSITESHNTQLFDLMIERGYPLNISGQSWPFLQAVANHTKPDVVDFIKHVFEKGVDFEFKSASGQTPLTAALSSHRRSIEQIRFYLQNGANIFARNSGEQNAFALAIQGGPEYTSEILTLILQNRHYDWNRDVPIFDDNERSKGKLQVIFTLMNLALSERFEPIDAVLKEVPNIDTMKRLQQWVQYFHTSQPRPRLVERVNNKLQEMNIKAEKENLQSFVSLGNQDPSLIKPVLHKTIKI